ncbi:MAG: hypothetical protein R6X02_05775 [Enhygromyxa sp.]
MAHNVVMHVLVFVLGDQVRKQLDAQVNKHIDFYEVGGRWSGILPRRGPEGAVEKVDSLRAGEFAWAEADAETEAAARAAFQAWRSIYERHGRPESLDEIAAKLKLERDRFGNYPDEVYDVYREQPALRAYDEAHPHSIYCPIKGFGFDEEEYVRDRVAGRFTPFALIAGGEWIEGPVSPSKPDAEWAATVRDRLRSLPPDTLVTAVDCHL